MRGCPAECRGTSQKSCLVAGSRCFSPPSLLLHLQLTGLRLGDQKTRELFRRQFGTFWPPNCPPYRRWDGRFPVTRKDVILSFQLPRCGVSLVYVELAPLKFPLLKTVTWAPPKTRMDEILSLLRLSTFPGPSPASTQNFSPR